MESVVVSVIIPVYDVEDYLRERMESVVGQTLREIEIICVDDGSTDGSLTILEEYAAKDPRITVYRCEHSDAGTARNYGMDRSCGKYISFLDADDLSDLNMLESMVEAAESMELDIVVCPCRGFSQKTGKVSLQNGTIKYELVPKTEYGNFSYKDCKDTIFQLFVSWTWDKLYRVSLLKENDIRMQALRTGNSAALACASLVKARRIRVLKKPLCTQRRDLPTSLTHTLDQSSYGGYLSTMLLKDYLMKWGIFEEVRKSYINYALHTMLWYMQKLESTPSAYADYFYAMKNQYMRDLGLGILTSAEIYDPKQYSVYQYIMNNTVEDFLFSKIITLQEEIRKRDRKIKQINGSFNQVKHSRSFMVGRAMTYLPRKVRDLYKMTCYAVPERFHAFSQDLREKQIRKHMSSRTCILAYENFHYFILNSILEICDFRNNYVEVYTSSTGKRELEKYLKDESAKIHWHIPIFSTHPDIDKRKRINDGVIAREIHKAARKKNLDRIIVVSPGYKPNTYRDVFYERRRDIELIAMVHNINQAFRSAESDPKIFDLFAQATSYAVLEENMAAEIRNNNLTDKNVYVWPVLYRLEEHDAPAKQSDKVTFAISGHVERERKDYDIVIDTFANLKDHYDKLRLILLGPANNPYGQYITDRCNTLIRNGLDVIYFHDFVPTDVFSRLMREADYILGPVNVIYAGGGQNEVYGKTKATGVVTDMIEYAKPGIVPSELSIPEDLQSSTMYYTDAANLHQTIIDAIAPETLSSFAAQAVSNSMKYSAERYRLM